MKTILTMLLFTFILYDKNGFILGRYGNMYSCVQSSFNFPGSFCIQDQEENE